MDTKSSNISLKVILIIIAIGIWVIALQNTGLIPIRQNVYVEGGYIDAEVSGSVRVNNTVDISGSIDVLNTVSVSGSVDVDNTVSVSIDEVLGEDNKKYYFNNR